MDGKQLIWCPMDAKGDETNEIFLLFNRVFGFFWEILQSNAGKSLGLNVELLKSRHTMLITFYKKNNDPEFSSHRIKINHNLIK